jgi:hypothetical protein
VVGEASDFGDIFLAHIVIRRLLKCGHRARPTTRVPRAARDEWVDEPSRSTD